MYFLYSCSFCGCRWWSCLWCFCDIEIHPAELFFALWIVCLQLSVCCAFTFAQIWFNIKLFDDNFSLCMRVSRFYDLTFYVSGLLNFLICFGHWKLFFGRSKQRRDSAVLIHKHNWLVLMKNNYFFQRKLCFLTSIWIRTQCYVFEALNARAIHAIVVVHN